MKKNLDDIFKDVIVSKSKGLKYPVDKNSYITAIDELSTVLSNFSKVSYSESYIINPEILYFVEVLNMINYITDKNSKDINKKAKNIINKLEVPSKITSIDSILTATQILGLIKNENKFEFSDYTENNYVVLFYLEEYLARKFKNNKVVDSIIKNRLNSVLYYNEYYLFLKNNISSIQDKYIFEMELLNYIYPIIKGYINSLKLMEISNKKLVLNEIRVILTHTQTTSDLLNKFKIDEIDTNLILNKKIKLLQK